ncbi:CRISPR-associated helicase/endonuclease Cas3 [Anaerosalibacter sp. Marseille-P3206]|uniref:CRISPR-associated helicase/endonuclease Cas3 n=1 Tax=Anaerosalibacter sp. Marseille-P3206 TaxID=1871005 RepID=UPI000987B378|nr:CRISPR-associated helicase/endonuclease Cas3 [Anaerosalibacter sp. Marseille-P3206]
MEYYAHYDKEKNEKQFLKDHLNSVAKLAEAQVPPLVCFDDIDNSIIRDVIYWTGYYHDIGKYSDYFQDYLINNKNSKFKNHAHISACFTYNYLNNNLNQENLDRKTFEVLIFLCYLSTRLHHTSLRKNGLFEKSMWKEIKKLEEHFLIKGEDVFRDLGFENKMDLECFLNYFDIELLKENKRGVEYIPLMFNNGRIRNVRWYFLLIYIFSILIDVDKLDSAYISPYKVKKISPDSVTKYLATIRFGKEKCDLMDNREEARITMLEVIDKLTDEEIKKTKFFTLTAPTGIGKTLSSLQCALKLQDRIQEVEEYTPRIITAIPFINIIEQNVKEYENVLSNQAKIVVHHRLSDFSARIASYKETPVDKALLETEAWDGDVILTTFVQLFHSIFTGENKPLKKINKLAGSIVILDEAQAIPEDYMPLVGATLQMISKYYGTRFILMTATQPKLLQFGDMLLSENNIVLESARRIELLPNNKKYFNQLNRTKFVPILNKKINTQEFIEIFFEKWESNKSGLVVVNTIKRSIEVYNGIKKELADRDFGVPIYYLSTNIIPKERRQVIDEVKKILDRSEPVILVSTQTIEAGVDLDFDMGFRDFAPLDSLIQTAGRINREGKKGTNLPVYIVQLGNDNNYIYDLSHRQSTLDLFKKKEEINEEDYGELIDEYYNLALARGISDKSRYIWDEGIMKLDFDALYEFKLIDNIGEVVDVFLEEDEKASDLADAYEALIKYENEFNYDLVPVLGEDFKDVKGELDIFQRKALIRLVMTKMNDYIIQIRINKLIKNRPIEFVARGDAVSSLFWIPLDQKEQYYNENTGFIDESGEGFIL